MKKKCLAMLCAMTMLLLCGCRAMVHDPVESALTTLVPGAQTQVHSPIAEEGSGDTFSAVLYFRFMQENLLAQESRKITVPADASVEKSIVEALVQGPSASSPELRSLFSSQVEVLSTLSQGNSLFVTFGESILTETVGNRYLQMQSLAATLIENLGYENVQVLVDRKSAPSTSLRLSKSYFNATDDGAAAPLMREEQFILNSSRTVSTILQAWLERDFERVYQFIAVEDARTLSVRPQLQEALAAMDAGLPLMAFTVNAGSVSPDGTRATVSTDMTLLPSTQDKRVLLNYPIMLFRENGIWKMRYQDFMKLMNYQY